MRPSRVGGRLLVARSQQRERGSASKPQTPNASVRWSPKRPPQDEAGRGSSSANNTDSGGTPGETFTTLLLVAASEKDYRYPRQRSQRERIPMLAGSKVGQAEPEGCQGAPSADYRGAGDGRTRTSREATRRRTPRGCDWPRSPECHRSSHPRENGPPAQPGGRSPKTPDKGYRGRWARTKRPVRSSRSRRCLVGPRQGR